MELSTHLPLGYFRVANWLEVYIEPISNRGKDQPLRHGTSIYHIVVQITLQRLHMAPYAVELI